MSNLTTPIKIVIVATVIFMCLNAFLPLQTSITPTELVAEAIQGPVKLVMALNKTTYSVSETVNITIEIVNISNSTIEVGFLPPSIAMFTVYDEKYNMIYNSDFPSQLPYALKRPLKPGESWGEVLVWKQRDEKGNQVPIGKYYIIAETPTKYGGVGVVGYYPPIRLETPALVITIS